MPRTWKLTAAILLSVAAKPAFADPQLSMVRSSDGTELLVAQAGDPKLRGILLIHSFGQSYLSFRRQFKSDLVTHFHLVAFDLRGHGGSAKPSNPAAYTDLALSADDVAAVITATGLRRPVIVGWSYGGIVVGDYVRKYGSGGISGVVFAGTLGSLVKPFTMIAPLGETAKDQRSTDIARNIASAAIVAEAYRTPEMNSEDERVLFATEMMLPAYARRSLMQRSFDNSDLIPAFAAIPTLFVKGAFDLGMGEAELAQLETKLPRMKLSRYAKTGQLSFFTAPDRFNAELSAFVNHYTTFPGDPAANIPRPTLPMTLAAFRAFRDLEFAARDLNKNGLLEPTELQVAAGGTLDAGGLARAMRINCGVALPACPLDQFRRQGDAEFAHADFNHDGILTADELKAIDGQFHAETP